MRCLKLTCLLILLGFILVVNAQTGTSIKINVTDADNGNALESVTVALGTIIKTSTNKEGLAQLRVTDEQFKTASISISYVGFIKQLVKINSRTLINISLLPDKKELQNVVVSGYGKVKRKEEVVGAITSITAKDLQVDRPIESFDKMLEGLAAGVQVQTNTELGTPVNINIRGQNTLTNTLGSSIRTGNFTSTQPLFVIDGVPITEQRTGDEGTQFGNEEYQNPLAGINPDDIESISILKDAAAAAVYGANASNGVIIITTKRGKNGKPKFSVGFSSGISNPINRIKWLSGPQYHGLVKELYLNENMPPTQAEALAGNKEINTDWFGITNRTGIFQNYDVEFSGGNEFNQYRLSASLLNQQSIQLGNDYKKAYIRLRLDNKLGTKWNLSTSLAPSITQKNALTVYSELTPIVPNIPTYNADSSFYQIVGVPNPVAVLEQNTNYAEGGTLNGNLRLDFQATKNLKISGNIGTDILLNKQNLYESAKNETGRTQNGFAQIYDRQSFSWIAFAQANWSPKIKDKHLFDILTGIELNSNATKLLRGSGTGFTYYRLNELSNASRQSSASSKQTSNSYSLYAQAAYKLSEKYFLNVSGRIDAASIFGTDVSSTLNAGFGVGWNISKEKWLIDNKYIDALRLRASFGTTGNSRIGSYAARGLYNLGSSGYNGQASSDPAGLPNGNLTWEKGYKTNIGFDLNFLKRFDIGVDWYSNITDDAISTIQIPVENGFRDYLANTSKLKNSGFDAKIGADIFKGRFNWTVQLNMGYNKNKILKVVNSAQRFGTSDNPVALRVGFSTSAIWGFKNAGVDPLTGVELFYDKTGKIIRADDRTDNLFSIFNSYVIGNRLPDLQGGFIQNFSYKGISVSLTFTYVWGSQQFINYRNEWNGNNLDNRNQSVNILDRWQKPGDITNMPILNRQARSGIRFVPNNSRYVYDETHIKLANASLSYALPAKVSQKLKASRISIFANGSNLFYWYRKDADKNRNGIKQYRFSFPEAQSFTGGIKLNW